jgi:hypothetical protein
VAGAAGGPRAPGQATLEALAALAAPAPAAAGAAPNTATASGQALLQQFNALHPALAADPRGPLGGGLGRDDSPAPGLYGPPLFTGPDCAEGVAVDANNVAYVVGWMTNPWGSTSAFVSRVGPDCDVRCTKIIPNLWGLGGPDCAYGVSVGPDGYAYVVGCMANPAGSTSAFVARVTPDCQCVCNRDIPNIFGARGPDCARGVSVGPDGNAYVVGCMADAAGTAFPFMARVNVDCYAYWVSLIPDVTGAVPPGCAYGVSVGWDNRAYIVGCMRGPGGGPTRAFVARFDDCTWLCTNYIPTLYGLPGPDCAYGVSVDQDNLAYVVGCMADSTAGTTRAFVARVYPDCYVQWAGAIPNLWGLPGRDCAYGVSTAPDGDAYVVGCMANPWGSTSAFVARVSPYCELICTGIIPNLYGLLPGPDCAYGVAAGPDDYAYEVGCMANPWGFTSAFVSRSSPDWDINWVGEIPNDYGLYRRPGT